MSPEATAPPERPAPAPARPRPRRQTSLFARGEPNIWLTGGALALCLFMIVGLLAIVFSRGLATFWPVPVSRIVTTDGRILLGEVTRQDRFAPSEEILAGLPEATRKGIARNDGNVGRRLVRTENFVLTGIHFQWVSDFEVKEEIFPEWALVVETLTEGRLYGMPDALAIDGTPAAQDPAEIWRRFQELHGPARKRWEEKKRLQDDELGALSRRREEARLEVQRAALRHGEDSEEHRAAVADLARVEATCSEQEMKIQERVHEIDTENGRYALCLVTSGGEEMKVALASIVRTYAPNRIGLLAKAGIYLSRWWEFLGDEPREANSAGGVFPAIFGTVIMTLLMTVFVVPFGVLAALYLREYAKQGTIVSAVRIAINNLAGVPSIVYGVFGLGFFCYILGAGIDDLFYPERLPNPTFGKGGVLWASATLALLTLPVVIVATEEALSAVPGSMRESSYACGASRWQTIKRIVLPRAMPGIMTGMILAMARGAGEVAPLMLVGAVKSAPALPADLGDWSGSIAFLPTGPLHFDRSFMHLGFHIFDVGFQSQNSEAARPVVFTTTLLLILIVLVLNVTAIWVRSRLRRKFTSHKF